MGSYKSWGLSAHLGERPPPHMQSIRRFDEKISIILRCAVHVWPLSIAAISFLDFVEDLALTLSGFQVLVTLGRLIQREGCVNADIEPAII